VIRNARFHRRRDAESLVNAAEIVVHVVKGDRVPMILDLLENALVNRVKRRICIRIVRFWRSM